MNFPIVSAIVALPALGALLLLLVRDERNEALVRNAALVVSLLVFAETLLLAWQFNAASADFQFVERYAWIRPSASATPSASTASASGWWC